MQGEGLISWVNFLIMQGADQHTFSGSTSCTGVLLRWYRMGRDGEEELEGGGGEWEGRTHVKHTHPL